MRAKSIIFISNNPTFGGSEVLWLQVAHRLAKAGYTVGIHIYRWESQPPILEQLLALGVKVFYFPTSGPVKDLLLRVKRKIFGDKPIWASFQPDLALISYGYHLRTSRQPTYCQQRHIPYLNLFQLVSEYTRAGEPNYVREIQSAVHNYFPSQQNRDMLSRQLGEKVKGERVIYNAWQVDFNVPFVWPAVNKQWRLAFIGRLDVNHKGLDLLMEALAAPRWRNRTFSIDFYGAGKEKSYLEKLAIYYGIANVSFKGHVDQVQHIWSDHHALILPSRKEGMSLALIEAMLCGRVTITTPVGGASELIEHGISGFVAQAPTSAFIDQALEEAWQQRDRWEEVGKAAYTRVRSILKQKPQDVIIQDIEHLLGGNTL